MCGITCGVYFVMRKQGCYLCSADNNGDQIYSNTYCYHLNKPSGFILCNLNDDNSEMCKFSRGVCELQELMYSLVHLFALLMGIRLI